MLPLLALQRKLLSASSYTYLERLCGAESAPAAPELDWPHCAKKHASTELKSVWQQAMQDAAGSAEVGKPAW